MTTSNPTSQADIFQRLSQLFQLQAEEYFLVRQLYLKKSDLNALQPYLDKSSQPNAAGEYGQIPVFSLSHKKKSKELKEYHGIYYAYEWIPGTEQLRQEKQKST
ncbi:MAG: hypothetical protein D6805_06460 [Planctomycetota bacterium]|nr:MAG: hypothetical protein D6805_06460 [Planctomycetota bacterium]